MLADDSDQLVAYEPALSEEEDQYSEHELAERREASEKKAERAAMEVVPKPKKFRMAAMHFSITYPQNDCSKSDAAARIEHKWPESSYVIAQEKHKDGNFHLHLFLQFPQTKNFKDSKCFDFITGKHGNYQTCNSVRAWVMYVIKHDNLYLAKGVDVRGICGKRSSVSGEIATAIDEGKQIPEVRLMNNGYFMMHKRKIEEYGAYVDREKRRKDKEAWVPPDLTDLTDSDLEIGKWLSENIRQVRPFKAPQLYIHGPKNLGKTSLIGFLERSLSIYHVPLTEDFYDDFDNAYDLVVIDEFCGQKTIQWMNLFLQGGPMSIRKKGSQMLKMTNVPVIILSNFPLRRAYWKADKDEDKQDRLDTLEARLHIVEIDSFIDVFKKKD